VKYLPTVLSDKLIANSNAIHTSKSRGRGYVSLVTALALALGFFLGRYL